MAYDRPCYQLADLPEEILICIFNHFDFKSLRRACLVCKHWARVGEIFLFRSPRILHLQQGINLGKAFEKDHSRTRHLRSLLVSTKFDDHSAPSCLPPYIRRMINLRVLRLETPDCNSYREPERKPWVDLQNRYEKIFMEASLLAPNMDGRRPLQSLRECTMHFVDTNLELYPISRYASVFLHPTLKSLLMSCTTTDRPGVLSRILQDDFKYSTSLEKLHLEESDVSGPSLALILSIPRALKSFVLSEGIRYSGESRNGNSARLNGNIRPLDLVEALSAVSESLESLSLSLGYVRPNTALIYHHSHHLNLVRMSALRNLAVSLKTLSLIRIPPPACDHNACLRLPPSLETLKVFGIPMAPGGISNTVPPRDPFIPLQPCFIQQKARHGTTKLRTLIYEYEYYEEDSSEDELNTFLADLVQMEQGPGPDPVMQNQPHRFAGVFPFNAVLADPQLRQAILNDPQHYFRFFREHFPGRPRPQRPGTQSTSSDGTNSNQACFSSMDRSKLALVTKLNNELLALHKQHGVHLRVDMTVLPRGYIPPYLYPENHPQKQEGWWDSENAREIKEYWSQLHTERAKRLREGRLGSRSSFRASRRRRRYIGQELNAIVSDDDSGHDDNDGENSDSESENLNENEHDLIGEHDDDDDDDDEDDEDDSNSDIDFHDTINTETDEEDL